MAPLDGRLGYGVLVHRLRDGRQCGRTLGDIARIAAVARNDRDHDRRRSRPSPPWLDYDKPGKHAPSASPNGKESLAAEHDLLPHAPIYIDGFAQRRTIQEESKTDFLDPNNLLNIVRQTAMIAIMTAGMTLVLSAGEIDLSIGSVAGLASVTTALAFGNLGPVPGLLVWALIAAANGHVALRKTTFGRKVLATGGKRNRGKIYRNQDP